MSQTKNKSLWMSLFCHRSNRYSIVTRGKLLWTSLFSNFLLAMALQLAHGTRSAYFHSVFNDISDSDNLVRRPMEKYPHGVNRPHQGWGLLCAMDRLDHLAWLGMTKKLFLDTYFSSSKVHDILCFALPVTLEVAT